jgi:hypothetical protein
MSLVYRLCLGVHPELIADALDVHRRSACRYAQLVSDPMTVVTLSDKP